VKSYRAAGSWQWTEFGTRRTDVAICEWQIDGPFPHVIRLEHGYWSGRAAIWLDGVLVYRRGLTLVDFGFEHRFEVDGVSTTVRCTCRLVSYRYRLLSAGRVVAPSRGPGWVGYIFCLGCVFAVLIALFAVWVVLVDRWGESVAPGGETLAECLAKMPEPARAEVFTQDGQDYLLLTGTTQVFPRLPSGPPRYVFNKTGRLVEWVPDSKSGTFWGLWPGASNRRAITREEMMRWPGATQ
jgi:hypothetical protein